MTVWTDSEQARLSGNLFHLQDTEKTPRTGVRVVRLVMACVLKINSLATLKTYREGWRLYVVLVRYVNTLIRECFHAIRYASIASICNWMKKNHHGVVRSTAGLDLHPDWFDTDGLILCNFQYVVSVF
jgi:hypothetical protein